MEVDPTVFGHEVEQSLAEPGIAGGRLDHFQVRGSGLEVGIEEGDVVTVPGRVDADADRDGLGGQLASGRGSW